MIFFRLKSIHTYMKYVGIPIVYTDPSVHIYAYPCSYFSVFSVKMYAYLKTPTNHEVGIINKLITANIRYCYLQFQIFRQ